MTANKERIATQIEKSLHSRHFHDVKQQNKTKVIVLVNQNQEHDNNKIYHKPFKTFITSHHHKATVERDYKYRQDQIFAKVHQS